MFWKVIAGISLFSAASSVAVYVARVQAHNRIVRAIDGETMAEIIGRLQAEQAPMQTRLPQYDARTVRR
jgi:hypothetical protein